MNKKWLAIGAACVAVIAIAVVFSLCNAFSGGAAGVVTVYGEAQGFQEPVTVQVALDGSGKIVGLDIAGDQGGAPDIGGPAVAALREEILRKGSIEGVEAVSGATITSSAVLEAISGAISGAQNVDSSAERERPSP